MARLHPNVDLYVGNDLAFALVQVVEDHHGHRLTVKQRGPGGGWAPVYILTSTSIVTGTAAQWAWDGLDEAGEIVRVTAVRRKTAGCSSCAGNRR